MGVHLGLEEFLRHKGFKPLLIVGDVQVDSKSLFDVSKNELDEEMQGKHKNSNKAMNLHAWVMLGDHIVDATLIPFYQKAEWLSGKLLDKFFGLVFEPNTNNPPFQHIPMFVGRGVVDRVAHKTRKQ